MSKARKAQRTSFVSEDRAPRSGAYLKGKGMCRQEEKERWADTYAHRIEHQFERWQKPLGIRGDDYRRHLKEELVSCCDDPLRRSLIESICQP